MTPETLAEIHARAMSVPPPWSAATFRRFLETKGAVLVTRETEGGLGGFALGRSILDETELLTLAVDPASQKCGLGRACLREFLGLVAATGTARVFLEVAADNSAARHLYCSAGFRDIATRSAYYRTSEGSTIDAHVMEICLDT